MGQALSVSRRNAPGQLHEFPTEIPHDLAAWRGLTWPFAMHTFTLNPNVYVSLL